MICPFCNAEITVSPDAIWQIGCKHESLKQWIKKREADTEPKCMHCLTPKVVQP